MYLQLPIIAECLPSARGRPNIDWCKLAAENRGGSVAGMLLFFLYQLKPQIETKHQSVQFLLQYFHFPFAV
jgi:hypothetical protein